MFGDFARWMKETGQGYDQRIGNFYNDLTDTDKRIFGQLRIDVFGDNRPDENLRLLTD